MFSMLGVNLAYVTAIGKLIGVVGLKELRSGIENANSGILARSNSNKSSDTTTSKEGMNQFTFSVNSLSIHPIYIPLKFMYQWYITLDSSPNIQKSDVEMGGGPKYEPPEFDDELIGHVQNEKYPL